MRPERGGEKFVLEQELLFKLRHLSSASWYLENILTSFQENAQ